MQHINLQPRRARNPTTLVSVKGLLAMGLSLVLGFGALAWTDAHRAASLRQQAAQDRAESERLTRLLQQLPTDTTQSERLAAEERELLALETVAARLSAGALGRAGSFTDTLKGLGRATTDGVWLTGIKLNQASGRMALEGKAVDASRVPALIAALGQDAQFTGTAFAALDIRRDESRAADAAQSKANDSSVVFRITSTETTMTLPTAAARPAAAASDSTNGDTKAAAQAAALMSRTKPPHQATVSAGHR